MTEPPPEPANRLPQSAKSLWRLQGLGNGIGAVVALGGGGSALGSPWQQIGFALAGTYLLLALTLIPELRHRRWRYEVREDQVDIRHGTFTVTRTIVPMRRVQRVATTRGMLEQTMELATVVFHTAAGSNEIPALAQSEADRVRTQIATLAGTADEL